MDDLTRDPARGSGLRTAATAMAAGAILASVAIGRLLELVVKSANPDGIDVSQPLAYLGPLLIASFLIAGVLIAATVVVIAVLHRREGAAAARIPWLVLGVQVVLVVVALALQAGVDGVTAG